MIKLQRPALMPDKAKKLAGYQDNVDKKPSYKERVNEAKKIFSSYNKKDNKVFDHIKKKLLKMCPAATRCHYCEDSSPDEVEHFKPKDLFPECCFDWGNYLYSCGPCNGSYKRNKFKVFTDSDGSAVDITRPRKGDIIQPPSGDPVLINPSVENPLDFMELDFSTFLFSEIYDSPTPEFERANYTIELLGLNRDILVEGRKSAFGSFRARLKEYVQGKISGVPVSTLKDMKQGFFIMPHITVWEEMKRQREYNSRLHAELKTLFDQAPEVLTFVPERKPPAWLFRE